MIYHGVVWALGGTDLRGLRETLIENQACHLLPVCFPVWVPGKRLEIEVQYIRDHLPATFILENAGDHLEGTGIHCGGPSVDDGSLKSLTLHSNCTVQTAVRNWCFGLSRAKPALVRFPG